MNLRNVGTYDIGLDIGTNSVGWSATEEHGSLCYFNGRPAWGVRLMPSAEPASTARGYRGQRRRYQRRRWRLDLLQELFCDEMSKVDPGFFIRLNQARLHPEDRAEGHMDYQWPLFNDADFSEVDYYEKFPTIYHLRDWLTKADEKADVRLIYLAFHNIVKRRGNFLQQENTSLSAKNASMDDSIAQFCDELQAWCLQRGVECSADECAGAMSALFIELRGNRAELQKEIARLLEFYPENALDKKTVRNMTAWS